MKKGAFTSILLLGTILFNTGCVSRKLEPEHTPELGIVQLGDGSVVFSLETEKGYEYQILYRDPDSGGWKLVKGCEAIKGTGGIVEIRKHFNSRAELPPFTVNFVKYR